MTDRVVVARGTYRDSVSLMQLSREVLQLSGVADVAVVMATPLNQGLVEEQGFDIPDDLSPDDLVVAVRAATSEQATRAVAVVQQRLSEGPSAQADHSSELEPRTFRSATRADPSLNLAIVSVPDQHAAYETRAALDAGLNVFCFSSGVSLEDEVALKRWADRSDLLLMGPDCGTAILDGIGYGFANIVARGSVGIVAASGTGLQQTCCLLAASGVGVSQAIGVGSRDLSDEVGGIMTRRALRLLASDDRTQIILLLSKPPGPATRDRVAEWVAETGREGVVAFLGVDGGTAAPGGNVEVVGSLEDAARRGAELADGRWEDPPLPQVPTTRGFVRGLFSGGSLCYEAMTVVAEALGEVRSNIPLRPGWPVVDVANPGGHAFIDFGHEDFNAGRPHPMIDPSLRNARFVEDARDPEVGTIVMDVILGRGAHADPAGDLAPLIEAGRRIRRGDLAVIVSLCGTDADPQGHAAQRRRLEAAGAIVTRSAAQAARAALRSLVDHG
jgi:FdrA protein